MTWNFHSVKSGDYLPDFWQLCQNFRIFRLPSDSAEFWGSPSPGLCDVFVKIQIWWILLDILNLWSFCTEAYRFIWHLQWGTCWMVFDPRVGGQVNSSVRLYVSTTHDKMISNMLLRKYVCIFVWWQQHFVAILRKWSLWFAKVFRLIGLTARPAPHGSYKACQLLWGFLLNIGIVTFNQVNIC